MTRGDAAIVLVCTALLLILFERLPAQMSPISYGVAVGISEFDDAQIPRISGADTLAAAVGKDLQSIGLVQRNILVRTNRKANTDAVRRALRRC